MADENNDELTIEIAGRPGAGKTTLVLALRNFLQSQGFTNVDVSDIDIAMGTEAEHLQEQRVTAIKDRKINLKSYQLKRNGKR